MLIRASFGVFIFLFRMGFTAVVFGIIPIDPVSTYHGKRVLPRLWRFTAKPPLLTEVSSSQCTSLVLLSCPHKLWLPNISLLVGGKADLCHLLRPGTMGPSLAISLGPNLSGRACCPSSVFSWPLYIDLELFFIWPLGAGVPVHTEYRCIISLWYDFLIYRHTSLFDYTTFGMLHCAMRHCFRLDPFQCCTSNQAWCDCKAWAMAKITHYSPYSALYSDYAIL